MSKNIWEKASIKNSRFKLFVFGPPGTFKTRTMLRFGGPNDGSETTLAVIDPEFGTDQYVNEFNFIRAKTSDPTEIFNAAKDIAKNPGSITTLGIDTFSVYHEALTSKYADLYLKRELRSAGHKKEYYTLQPRDYQPINREASNFVRFLLECDLNIICNCQVKDQWGNNMDVVGTTHDGWKRLPHYFDTIVEIFKNKDGNYRAISTKDRTNHLLKNQEYEWNSDEEAHALLSDAFSEIINSSTEIRSYTTDLAPLEPEDEDDKEPQLVDPNTNAGLQTVTIIPMKDKLDRIINIKKQLGITDRNVWNDMVSKYSVKSAKDMTLDQLDSFIKDLETQLPEKEDIPF